MISFMSTLPTFSKRIKEINSSFSEESKSPIYNSMLIKDKLYYLFHDGQEKERMLTNY